MAKGCRVTAPNLNVQVNVPSVECTSSVGSVKFVYGEPEFERCWKHSLCDAIWKPWVLDPSVSPLASPFECCEDYRLYRARRQWFCEQMLARTFEEKGLGQAAEEVASASKRLLQDNVNQGSTSYRSAYRNERDWYAKQLVQLSCADTGDIATTTCVKSTPLHACRWVAWAELVRACSIMVLTLSVWFASNAFLPEISLDYELDGIQGAFLTASVNIGFMMMATSSAMLQLPERAMGKHLVAVGALLCTATSAAFVVRMPFGALVVVRLFTGAGISLIYPILVRHVVSWFPPATRGLALGSLIGSFTLGIAVPSLLRALLPTTPWRRVTLATSGCALLGGCLVWGMRDGPHARRQPGFSGRAVLRVVFDRNWWLITISYVGHNLELFGGWSSLGNFLQESFGVDAGHGDGKESSLIAPVATFGIISTGALGGVIGGLLADRIGRRALIAVSHVVSGSMLALLPVAVAPPGAAGLWGLASIADSAQYSAAISEVLGNKGLVGTAVALSLALGFSSTAAGIFLVPLLRESVGWVGTYLCLALGPAVGLLAVLAVKADQGQK
eukprot:CAMPEP_0179207684 /NCGR_PEP_ID=MMETSP0796-20121207/103567_1 /TAXON_ID=73915 /ORGANISM="Pyrodinium bahamense, Strain pbaha01" /LENGTH=558 /DNA_ID=CAMNT_0020912623 /DNA_START=12 /DNA_END=1689 /DNA_ORIENTATION=-